MEKMTKKVMSVSKIPAEMRRGKQSKRQRERGWSRSSVDPSSLICSAIFSWLQFVQFFAVLRAVGSSHRPRCSLLPNSSAEKCCVQKDWPLVSFISYSSCRPSPWERGENASIRVQWKPLERRVEEGDGICIYTNELVDVRTESLNVTAGRTLADLVQGFLFTPSPGLKVPQDGRDVPNVAMLHFLFVPFKEPKKHKNLCCAA